MQILPRRTKSTLFSMKVGEEVSMLPPQGQWPRIRFEAHMQLAADEALHICGALPKLGGWNAAYAPSMAQDSGSGRWVFETSLQPSSTLEFKLIVRSPSLTKWVGCGQDEDDNIVLQIGLDSCRLLSAESITCGLFISMVREQSIAGDASWQRSCSEGLSTAEKEDYAAASEQSSTRPARSFADSGSYDSGSEAESVVTCVAACTVPEVTMCRSHQAPKCTPPARYPGIYAADADLDLNLPQMQSLPDSAVHQTSLWEEARKTWEHGLKKHQDLVERSSAFLKKVTAATEIATCPIQLEELLTSCLEVRNIVWQAIEAELDLVETRDLEHAGQGRTSAEITLLNISSQLRKTIEHLREQIEAARCSKHKEDREQLRQAAEDAVIENDLKQRARVACPTKDKVPVFVMLPLDWAAGDGTEIRDASMLRTQLQLIKQCGVRGVMADVWWGLSEPQPGQYCFGAVFELCCLLSELQLELQATMSFHQCGGNVGDNVTIPLPDWVLEVAREEQLLYCDRYGQVSEDCLSLSADESAVFPGSVGTTVRTAKNCYRDFVASFARACLEYLGKTVVEIQVGMGPCGELRYPSYMLSQGWCFPGVGLVMAYDPSMRRMLERDTEMTEPPEELPTDLNGSPEDSTFFGVPWRQLDGSKPFCQGAGKTFLEWYQQVLLDHGEGILIEAIEAVREARAAPDQVASSSIPIKVGFSVKIAGIHWAVQHPSRAAEACAGYNCCTSVAADAYADIAQMLARAARTTGSEISLNFTCLEMETLPNAALSDPEGLVAQVRRACANHNVPLCGENSLGFDLTNGGNEFKQMRKQIRSWSWGPDRMEKVTLLRLGQEVAPNRDLSALHAFAHSL
eukprot:TRINITY_DN48759_c0_g1_i1.p1 TRINITY_DN48759_c0_g1~~TRINITY_DN48759_c0_g1_i1.p1  ORF type:complete len:856 (+),score=139.94 TRINITY_DN48759_c0_g1_i1:78-2645(+)